MKKAKRLIALSMSALMLLSACAKAPTSDTTAATTQAPVTTASDNTYKGPKDYKGWTTSMATFNSQMYTNSKTFMNLGTFVAMMASKDGTGKLEFVPHHASELPKSKDGKVWTVKLRDNLEWDDGTKIDANTYAYTMKMLIDPKLVNKNAKYMFDTCIVKNAQEYFKGKCAWEDVGVKVIDPLTLEITLEYAATELDFWTTICTLIWPVKQDVYEATMNADKTSTTYGTSLATTPSCGFFTLKEWVTDGHDLHVRNDKDPLVKEGYIKLDSYNRRYISSNATRSELFFSGELDNHSLSGADYDTYKNDPRAHVTLSPNVWGFFMNGASKNVIMQNVDFRHALYFAAPREKVSTDVNKLYPSAPYLIAAGIYVGDPISGGEYYRDTAAAKANVEKYHSDEKKALELFNKAYSANGSKSVKIEYIYFEGQEAQKRQAEIMQETYENLFGKDRFTMSLRAMPPAAAYDVYRKGEYDLGLGVRLANVFNPWATLNVWTSEYADKYITGFANEEFDKLQKDTVFGELVNKPDERSKALARMEELLLDYACFCPMMQNDNVVMYAERIELATEEYLPFVGYAGNQADITAE